MRRHSSSTSYRVPIYCWVFLPLSTVIQNVDTGDLIFSSQDIQFHLGTRHTVDVVVVLGGCWVNAETFTTKIQVTYFFIDLL